MTRREEELQEEYRQIVSRYRDERARILDEYRAFVKYERGDIVVVSEYGDTGERKGVILSSGLITEEVRRVQIYITYRIAPLTKQGKAHKTTRFGLGRFGTRQESIVRKVGKYEDEDSLPSY